MPKVVEPINITHTLELKKIPHYRQRYNKCKDKSSENKLINPQSFYYCKIYKRWYVGKFTKQWYGWSFDNWGTSGMQLDMIEQVYQIMSPKPTKIEKRGVS